MRKWWCERRRSEIPTIEGEKARDAGEKSGERNVTASAGFVVGVSCPLYIFAGVAGE